MVLLLVALPIAAIASSRSGASDFASKPKKPKALPHFETTIVSATPTALTIKEEKNQRTLTITPFTEITVDGQKASAADLKPGMFVSFVLTDATRLSRVTATTKK